MTSWIISAVVGLAALLIGSFAGYRYNKSIMESKIGRTEEYAKKHLDETTRKADEKKKEMILEAKEEVLRQKSELDKEINARRADIQRSEHRAQQREEQLEKKMDALDQKEKQLAKRQDNIAEMEAEAEALKAKQVTELERIAGMTQDEARQNVIDRVQKEAYHDAAAMVREIETKAKEEIEKIFSRKNKVKYLLYLQEAVKLTLLKNGIPEKNIFPTSICTYHSQIEGNTFCSYRRTKSATQRMLTAIMMK